MSTRSVIAILRPNGKVRAVYCHSDGYPTHNGLILLTHYNEPKKVEALIGLGGLSVLRANIGEKHDFDAKCPDGYHTLPQVVNEWTTAYHRDRDEPLDIMEATSLEDLGTTYVYAGWIEYLYVYDIANKRWHFCDVYSKNPYQTRSATPVTSVDEMTQLTYDAVRAHSRLYREMRTIETDKGRRMADDYLARQLDTVDAYESLASSASA